MKNKIYLKVFLLIGLAAPFFASAGYADSVAARCDIYPAGKDHAQVMIPCTFSQYQGNIYIDRSDGRSHSLTPAGDTPGNFIDDRGQAVYRQSGSGDSGLIFRFPQESIFLYWDTSSLSALKRIEGDDEEERGPAHSE